jgi:hypothetical protein
MSDRTTIGWREWLSLPELQIQHVKAKVDTGARSSCLHAVNIVEIRRGAKILIEFDVHPLQRNNDLVVRCQAPLIDYRTVKSSNGKPEIRPVVEALIRLNGEDWPIELTLTAREKMGFRMLLGRQAIRGRFVVDPGRSFLMRDLIPKKAKRPKTSRAPKAKRHSIERKT